MKSIYQKFLALILFTPLTVLAAWDLNLTKGVTPISREIYDMHMVTLWVVTVIGVLVFGVMFWSIFHHRKSKGVKASNFSHSTTVEIIWTIVPTVIIIALAIPATKLLIKMDDTSEAKITIKATGIQWKWKYDYLDEDITLYSSLDAKSQEVAQRDSGQDPMEYENYLLDVDEPLVVPINTKLRILTTAEDVIHAWWVPELGWKRDAIPGFINDNWAIIEEPGTYRGNCTEICGKGHGYMPIVVKAVSMEDYEAWIDDRKALKLAALESQNKTLTMDESMAEGEKVYKKQCLMCHQANGQGVPGAFPALAGSEIALKKENTLEHLYRIIYGKNLMPKFGDQLSDVEIATVTTYERNAWGNNTGDLIQPKEVAEARKNQTK